MAAVAQQLRKTGVSCGVLTKGKSRMPASIKVLSG